jgi:hypothetical protein
MSFAKAGTFGNKSPPNKTPKNAQKPPQIVIMVLLFVFLTDIYFL